ncbi:MAG: NAD(P)/FAD-dependent oxidoreductase [Acutalibacteraceae bacterium]
MIRINNIKLPVDYDDRTIQKRVCEELRCDRQAIDSVKLHRLSVDARKKSSVHFSASVDVKLNISENKVLGRCKSKNAAIAQPYRYEPPKLANRLDTPPLIVGAGPAGLFAGLILAQAGCCPIIIERGGKIDERIKSVESFSNGGKLDTNSNIQFGEGGAGAFSDGKLNTGTKDSRARKVLEEFVAAGAPEEILYRAKPHVGTDYLHIAVKNLREKIISLGGVFRFNTTVTDFIISNGKISAVITDKGEKLESQNIILALGHSSRDTYKRLYDLGIAMEQKPFSIGVRIEHLREKIDASQYGSFAEKGHLGAADYKLAVHLQNGRGVYTFCMCPGGEVVPAASELNSVVTNGMSRFARDMTNSNSALLVGIGCDDFGGDSVLDGIELQRKFERAAFKLGGESYFAPAQRVEDFLSNRKTAAFGEVKPSYRPGVTGADLNTIMPEYMSSSLKQGILRLDEKLKGFNHPDAVLTGMETRSSAPLRIIRNEKYQSLNCKGLYPCGEGAGYAGGIISAAVDGIKCAEAIIRGE